MKILGPTQFWDQKKLRLKNMVVPEKKFGVQKNFWSTKILGPQKFGSKNFGSNKFLGTKNFGSKKFWIQKNILGQKILGPRIFWVKKSWCLKKMLVHEKYLGQKKNLGVH